VIATSGLIQVPPAPEVRSGRTAQESPPSRTRCVLIDRPVAPANIVPTCQYLRSIDRLRRFLGRSAPRPSRRGQDRSKIASREPTSKENSHQSRRMNTPRPVRVPASTQPAISVHRSSPYASIAPRVGWLIGHGKRYALRLCRRGVVKVDGRSQVWQRHVRSTASIRSRRIAELRRSDIQRRSDRQLFVVSDGDEVDWSRLG